MGERRFGRRDVVSREGLEGSLGLDELVVAGLYEHVFGPV